MQLYFKLFNSIKSPHEANELARLELLGLLGEVERVSNFADELLVEPLRSFSDATFAVKVGSVRVVDCFTHELPYGRIQGYKTFVDQLQDISRLVRRLAYTREIFVVLESASPEGDMVKLFRGSILGRNAQYAIAAGRTLYRFITNQYFLEKSEYISKLSRNEKEVDANVDRLLTHLTHKIYRIPASATMRIGKRLEDYFATREEPSLYLTHNMHPYTGKFHPKLARALLNYVCPSDKGTVVDNFAGSGTLLVEAVLMGLNAVGIEINPLSVLMGNVKCQALSKLDPSKLKKDKAAFMKRYAESTTRIRSTQKTLDSVGSHEKLKREQRMLTRQIKSSAAKLRTLDKASFHLSEDDLIDIIVCRRLMARITDRYTREFMLLALSRTISDVTRRKTAAFREAMEDSLQDMFLRVYLFDSLKRNLEIEVGDGACFELDARDVSSAQIRDLDGNVDSPPYSTALDYIKNDQPQLTLLSFDTSLSNLNTCMIGSPGNKYDSKRLLSEITQKRDGFMNLPGHARRTIDQLFKVGREDQALRCMKFFQDTYTTMEQMWSVLKPGAKYAIVIGNNHFKIGDDRERTGSVQDEEGALESETEFDSIEYLNLPAVQSGYVEVRNDQVVIEIGGRIGFEFDRKITRILEKTRAGNIRYESIVILRKPRA